VSVTWLFQSIWCSYIQDSDRSDTTNQKYLLIFVSLHCMKRTSAVRKRNLSPRKTPSQERSRATVEALLDATADILVRHGYAQLTTNPDRGAGWREHRVAVSIPRTP
jgi:hypothetical protein